MCDQVEEIIKETGRTLSDYAQDEVAAWTERRFDAYGDIEGISIQERKRLTKLKSKA
ncbi:hypothetical protein L6279_05975 [Candidatus Parcubacteria bacterium]|nr:hypothetical protein [Candidatus Parcubacteria bacterium]